MKLIAIQPLRDFYLTYRDAEQPIKSWVKEVKKANWNTSADVKATFKAASILKSRRVVFNIKGNDYRIVCAIAYQFGAVYVKFVGTHQEYNEINSNKVGE
ncbi:MAG: type II toxin-antitoxin system HigB family toxin [Enterobacteriaceae bacterium]|jgi:mRNA interferase HigB|nr:type II toxin-antitoxin system HigB family toxin [Enterobacteriaceae bacterium]